jgi:hypothetical protein
MKEMNETEIIAIKSIVYAQAFIDTLDQFEGTNAYRQRLKQKAKQFKAEVEKFLDAAYCGGETESNVIALLERCESEIDEVINKEVQIVD